MFGPTIQGEGAVIGYQTFFIRFGGCDYRCERCDSLHAVLPQLVKQSAEYLTAADLAAKVSEATAKIGPYMWTFSGGNPCMWNLTDLVKHMKSLNLPIAVETQGTIWQEWLRYCDFVTVSPKGPGMGEKFEPKKFQRFVLGLTDGVSMGHPGFTVKVVVFDQRDIEFIVEILNSWPYLRNRMFISIGNIFPPEPAKRGPAQQPKYQLDDAYQDISHDAFVSQVLGSYAQIAEEVLADPRLYGVRILPQLHTLLWGNEKGR